MSSGLDRVSDAGYLGDLTERPIEEIRSLRTECQAIETGLSYLRRVIQGRLDLVAAEAKSRSEGQTSSEDDSLQDLIERLPDILADRTRPAGVGRLPQTMTTGEVDPELEADVDGAIGPGDVSNLNAMSTEDLLAATDRLADVERRVSDHRRILFDRLDALQAEIARRYRTGEASVDSLL